MYTSGQVGLAILRTAKALCLSELLLLSLDDCKNLLSISTLILLLFFFFLYLLLSATTYTTIYFCMINIIIKI